MENKLTTVKEAVEKLAKDGDYLVIGESSGDTILNIIQVIKYGVPRITINKVYSGFSFFKRLIISAVDLLRSMV